VGANETAIDRLTPLHLLIEQIATDVTRAQQMAQKHFHFEVRQAVRRKRIPLKKQVAIFERDKYRCRYSGDRLVFPGTLLVLQTGSVISFLPTITTELLAATGSIGGFGRS
jgi:hypothetical protein